MRGKLNSKVLFFVKRRLLFVDGAAMMGVSAVVNVKGRRFYWLDLEGCNQIGRRLRVEYIYIYIYIGCSKWKKEWIRCYCNGISSAGAYRGLFCLVWSLEAVSILFEK